ncbi:hypothetical protein FJD38_02460 [Pseudomonas saxonica]|uniref:Uncharacterized protein n=1 Tax=Pseudomonas saxonica TaxID=2600598 RepID=A0ABY3GMA3_9PSED|nr:hypothetical protein [Pseudomonas saxonica]TWR92505.1 hypothetical protein FJD38_02460 [Pseudomonas saxonica]
MPASQPGLRAIFNNALGAPYVHNHTAFMSIAHHQGLGLASVSAHIVSGIDIEAWQPFDTIPLCSWGYREPWLLQMAVSQNQPVAILKCALWVCTEALAKSLGTGLNARADTFEVASLERMPWGWLARFKRYPDATAYLWPCAHLLTGLVIHQYTLQNPALTGQALHDRLAAAPANRAWPEN